MKLPVVSGSFLATRLATMLRRRRLRGCQQKAGRRERRQRQVGVVEADCGARHGSRPCGFTSSRAVRAALDWQPLRAPEGAPDQYQRHRPELERQQATGNACALRGRACQTIPVEQPGMTTMTRARKRGNGANVPPPGKVKVTLQMVADHCGVSASTVSRILNGTAQVSEAKQEVVRLAIETLGFVPNPVA